MSIHSLACLALIKRPVTGVLEGLRLARSQTSRYVRIDGFTRIPAFILLVALTVVSSRPVDAQRIDPDIIDAVDQLFADWAGNTSPGGVVGIVRGGELVYAQGYGLANLEYPSPNTPNTVFPIASTSKQFTAFAIAMLEEEGRLTLDDDVRQYVPELPEYGYRMTIRDLLYHTSGLRDNAELMLMAGFLDGDAVTIRRSRQLILNQEELNFEPGSEFLYSNSGYVLLALIVERITETSFGQYLEEHLFAPLGMEHTYVHDDHATVTPYRAYAYEEVGPGRYQHHHLVSEEVGTTGIYSTVADLAAWLANLGTAKVGGSRVIERIQETGQLQDGFQLDYAFGLLKEEYRGLVRLSHGGRSSGFLNNVAFFPEADLGVIVLANVFPADPILDPWTLSMEIADLFLHDLGQPPSALPHVPETFPANDLSDEDVGRISGWYWNGSNNTLRRVFVRDDTLRYYRNVESQSALLPIGPYRYAMVSDHATIEIVFEPAGADAELLHFEEAGERPTVMDRVHGPWRPSLTKLEAYVGVYYSRELDTSYEITLHQGGLSVEHLSLGTLRLTPVIRDHFRGGAPWWFGYDAHFLRSDTGDVTGFRLSNYHAKGIRFTRLQ